jgi:hypothetical protein
MFVNNQQTAKSHANQRRKRSRRFKRRRPLELESHQRRNEDETGIQMWLKAYCWMMNYNIFKYGHWYRDRKTDKECLCLIYYIKLISFLKIIYQLPLISQAVFKVSSYCCCYLVVVIIVVVHLHLA